MTNIKCGSCIRNKEDAHKCLKDFGVKTETDGWKEMKERHAKVNRAYRKRYCEGIKDRIPNRRFSFNWKPGQWEQIFGGKGEEKATSNEDK